MAASVGLPLRPGIRQDRPLGGIETAALHPYALPNIPARRVARAGLKSGAMERLSAHGLRTGFIIEAYKAGARNGAIMEHSRHNDIRSMRGYVRRAKPVGESPAGLVGL